MPPPPTPNPASDRSVKSSASPPNSTTCRPRAARRSSTASAQLAKDFQTEHDREPTAVEMLALSQQATLETRQAKHEPRSLAEQRHTWRTEAVEVLGSQRELSTPRSPTSPAATAARQRAAITDEWVRRAGRHRHRQRRRNTLHLADQPRPRRSPAAAALHRSPGRPDGRQPHRRHRARRAQHRPAPPRRHRDE